MRPNARSASGILMMLAIIPIFAGLLACMPVPIGDPERSRIDPDITGAWFMKFENDFDGIYNYQPFDKRAWLMTGVPIEEGSDYEGEPCILSTFENAVRLLETLEIGNAGLTASATVTHKVWLAKIGGQTFMTWEPANACVREGQIAPEYWFTFRVENVDKDTIELYMLKGEHDAFEAAKEPVKELRGHEYPGSVRRSWERALRKVAKNVEDDELYGEAVTLRRVPEDLVDTAAELFQEVIEFE